MTTFRTHLKDIFGLFKTHVKEHMFQVLMHFNKVFF